MSLPSEIRKGDAITADFLNRILREVKRLSNMRGSGGVEIVSTGAGITFRGSESILAIKRGTLDADLASGDTGDLSVTEWDSDIDDWADTTKNITVRIGLPITSDLTMDTVCWVVKVFDVWFVLLAACE